MNLEVGICLPQEAESVAIVRGVITDTLSKLGITPECVDDIRLALSEACTNVVLHAAPNDEYEVWVRVDAERCELRIKNAGEGFDADTLAGVMPGTSSASGRGVAIMREVMDHVSFRSEPEAGTVVHLIKAIEVDPKSPFGRSRRTS